MRDESIKKWEKKCVLLLGKLRSLTLQLPVRPQSQALFQLTDSHFNWMKMKTFGLKAGLQLGLGQDQDRAPFPALVIGNSPSTLWDLYLLLGITQSCWEPLNSNATNTGIHQETPGDTRRV